MTEIDTAADTAPPPAATEVVARNPLQHSHACPRCYAIATCERFCFTEFDADGKLYGQVIDCDTCANPPSEAFDIFSLEVRVGDVLRCDDDALVYEVNHVDHRELEAELTTVVGYPKGFRRMRLATDGSPARSSIQAGVRLQEPLWYRVGK
jgi:hypothetical protein